MRHESFAPNESSEKTSVVIEPEFESFVPKDFKRDPVEYFERSGTNIKPGGVEFKDSGKVKEDPTATKFLPDWVDNAGQVLQTVGKRVNVEKSQVGKSGDPFYEYTVMQHIRSLGLPTATPIARVEQQGTHIIVMERVSGYGLYDPAIEELKDDPNIRQQAEAMLKELQEKFENAGIFRNKWSPKDMIFDIDIPTRTIRSVTPIDWERTKIIRPAN